MAMHSISDLTTYAQDAKGDIPPPLVGASTTVVGDTMYLFGGRLNTLRRMTSDIYSFDLSTSVWEKLAPQSPESLTPTPRYFHSADSWNGHLVIFGGMGYASRDSDTLCVLSDVRFFSLRDRRWLNLSNGSLSPVEPTATNGNHGPLDPRPRYAHLSAISSSRLYIIGGQDMTNQWLDDIHVYDLSRRLWLEKREYPRHCGTYRSVAVSGLLTVRNPVKEGWSTKRAESPFAGLKRATSPTDSMLHPHPLQAQSDQLVYMPYSSEPTVDHPSEIHLYSNYNVSLRPFRFPYCVLNVWELSMAVTPVYRRSTGTRGNHSHPGIIHHFGAIRRNGRSGASPRSSIPHWSHPRELSHHCGNVPRSIIPVIFSLGP